MKFMERIFSIEGQLVDITAKKISPQQITIQDGNIISRQDIPSNQHLPFIIPGFIDAHVHVESSMLAPSEFARLAVVHGTVATISDPHEIANVCGMEGVEYMIENGNQVPFKFYFGAPSCVPATPFETAGGAITVQDIEHLMHRKEVVYLAEMMNWPGTLARDPEVMAKINAAQHAGKPIDGHAPGLKGEQAIMYASAGITTDHECFTMEEALDKVKAGMKIIIREGSAAKNFDALVDLLDHYPEQVMFCSDDKHPDNLAEGHIDQLVRRAVKLGKPLFNVLQAACINPIAHYGLKVGSLQVGQPADFVLLEDLENFKVLETYIEGELVSKAGKTLIERSPIKVINNFRCETKRPEDFRIPALSSKVRVIQALDGQLITPELHQEIVIKDGLAHANLQEDILKMAVINRYEHAEPALAFIKNFGLKEGALASSVGHDSHNIIAVGVDDKAICKAVNLLIKAKGGIAAVNSHKEILLPLPIGGIMSNEDGYHVAEKYIAIDLMAKEMGSTLQSPFMTLSFMALLVIPDLKLSDKGLFDGQRFTFTDLFLA
jgi:adenine deaminase